MKQRSKGFRARRLTLAVAMVAAVAVSVPFSGTAIAQAPAGCALNVEPETDTNGVGANHSLTATLVDPNATDAQTCTQQDINAAGGIEIDAEITGPGDTDNGDSPTTPDLTCTITGTGQTQTSCVLGPYTSAAAGLDTIRAFVDADKNNANNATDADLTEGQNEATTAGAQTEPDRTDVVTKSWFTDVPANAAINCVDQSGDDTQINPVSGADATETYTCTVFSDTDNDRILDANETPIEGVTIDAEIQGVNDPDDRDFGSAQNATVDMNNACTTAANGQCTIAIGPTESQAGTAQICFFTDANSNNVFAAGGNENDGGQCDAENSGNEATAQRTDVVTKSWAQAAATNVTVTPDVDNNVAGTAHTATATITDQFGNPVSGANVDFYVRGRNTVTTRNVVTNAQGQAVMTYTDAGSVTAQGQDTITACVDLDSDDAGVTEVAAQGQTPASVNCETGEPEDDALKNWFPQGQLPAATDVRIDMTPANAPNECPDIATSNQFTTTATNTVGAAPHDFCVAVFDQNGVPIAGQQVTLSLTGPGNFTNQAGTTDTAQQATVTTDREGDGIAFIESTTAGTATITATAGGRSGTATKEFVSAPALARNIDCSPETATNPSGTSHTISCVVTDRFGNPVEGVNVTATEEGPGRFAGAANDATDASGIAELIITSSANETGAQTVTASLPGSRTDTTVEECERAAGSPSGTTTAGVCSDQVTKTWGPSPSPSASASPTPTVTATVTASPSPGVFPRTLTLESSKARLTFGKPFTLSGAITSSQANLPTPCVANVTVTISRDVIGGAAEFVDVATATTAADGTYSVNRVADRGANYIAHIDQAGNCAEANSEPEPVLVRVKVGLRLSDDNVTPGTTVRLRAKVKPCGGHQRDRVVLYRLVNGEFAKVASKRTNRRCIAVFRQQVNASTAFQARWPKQHADHLSGRSRKKAVIA